MARACFGFGEHLPWDFHRSRSPVARSRATAENTDAERLRRHVRDRLPDANSMRRRSGPEFPIKSTGTALFCAVLRPAERMKPLSTLGYPSGRNSASQAAGYGFEIRLCLSEFRRQKHLPRNSRPCFTGLLPPSLFVHAEHKEPEQRHCCREKREGCNVVERRVAERW